MSQPQPLLALLRRLKETTAGVENMRFFVDTAEGLRLLSLKEALTLIPDRAAVEPHQCTAAEPVFDTSIIQQLVDQLAQHQQRMDDVMEAVADLQMVEFERHVKKKKKDKKPFRPDESVAVGLDALAEGAIDRENVAVGLCAGVKLDGAGNVLVGPYAGFESEGELTDVTAVGFRTLANSTQDFSNVTALGAYAQATGNDQVVLGDHRTNVVTISSPQRRSDTRDMAEVKPLELGLDFVLEVKPIQYLEDPRDAYIDWASKPSEPHPLRPQPEAPELSSDDPEYQPLLVAYRADKAQWDREVLAYEIALGNYHSELGQWIEDNQLARIRADGTHQGVRTHTGFNAGQLLEVTERLGVDLALVQDHSVNGGQSVKTHSDAEMLAILWNAVRQLTHEVRSSDLTDRVASELVHRHTTIAEATQASKPVSPVLSADE